MPEDASVSQRIEERLRQEFRPYHLHVTVSPGEPSGPLTVEVEIVSPMFDALSRTADCIDAVRACVLAVEGAAGSNVQVRTKRLDELL